MNDQPQDFTLSSELPQRPSECFARHFNEYNRRWHETMQKGKGSMPDMSKLIQSEGGYHDQSQQLSEETMSSRGAGNFKMINTISDIVHITIQQLHIYVQRDLLTSISGSKLAKVFSQDLSDFELVRDPTIFQHMIEYLRQDRQISRLKLQRSDMLKLIEELNYWGISQSVFKLNEQNKEIQLQVQQGINQCSYNSPSGNLQTPGFHGAHIGRNGQEHQQPCTLTPEFNKSDDFTQQNSNSHLIKTGGSSQSTSGQPQTVHRSKISLLGLYQHCCMKMLQSQSMQRELHQLDRAQELQQEQIIPFPYHMNGAVDSKKRQQMEHLVAVEQRMAAKMKQIKQQIDQMFTKQHKAVILDQQKPIQQKICTAEDLKEKELKLACDIKLNSRLIRRRKSRGYVKCEHREEKHYSNGMCKRCYHKKYFKEKVQKNVKNIKEKRV